MQPYYDEDGIVIYHGDCRTVFAQMSQAVDHAIFDPPYSAHVHSKSMRGASGWKGKISEKRVLGFDAIDQETIDAVSVWCASTVRRWCLAFSDTESAHLWREAFEASGQDYVRTCFWRKLGGAPQFTGDRPAVACEAMTLAHVPGKKRWNGGGKHGFYEVPIVLNRGASATEWRCHPTQKPERLMAQLVADFTDVGETLCDPFMGSGSTLVAAKRMGRKAIGIEQKEEYCEVAVNRLRQSSMIGALLA